VKIVWTDEAIDDLKSIHDYIAKDSIRSAKRLSTRIIGKVEILIEFPISGRMVPEFQNEAVRELIEGKYRIVYRVNEQSIEIIRIHHGSRLF